MWVGECVGWCMPLVLEGVLFVFSSFCFAFEGRFGVEGGGRQ
jgi:hypothetical protein